MNEFEEQTDSSTQLKSQSEDDEEASSDIEDENQLRKTSKEILSHQQQEQQQQTAKLELQPSDFYFGNTLGEGAYARVVHAKSKKTGAEFAIKIMEKMHIKRENKVKNVLMERKILTMISHPLVVKFHFSFQDPGYLYMCMDLVPGGILLDLINLKQQENELKNISDTACDFSTGRFYISEIVSSLEYIHSLGIVHRDIKPENILLDRNGHIKLGDFGTATIITDNESPRTSFVGTQDYVSPEVLSGERKATKACDLWAVGCMIYQIFTGISPFRGATEYLTFELIMGHCRKTKPLVFPSSIPLSAQDLIEKLLQSNEWERLGAGEVDEENNYNALRCHPFFEEIDWLTLVDSTPPYQPDSRQFPNGDNMRDGALDDWLLEGEATPIAPMHVKAGGKAVGEESPKTSSVWSQLLEPGELQVFTSIIYKRKGLFSKRRQLILTDKPRLFYLDPESFEIKGEIPWTKSHPVSCVSKTDKEFDVKCSVTQRSYHLTDHEVGSAIWIEYINEMLNRK